MDPDLRDPVTRLDLEPGGDRWCSVCFMDCDPSFCNFMDCEGMGQGSMDCEGIGRGSMDCEGIGQGSMDCEGIGRGSMDCEDKLDCSVASSITDK